MPYVRRALLWAVSASLLGVVLWSVLAGTVSAFAFRTEPLTERLRMWPWAILGTGFWAVFIGVAAMPVYALVFGGWLRLVARRPDLEATPGRLALVTLGLSAPLVLALTHGFASGFDPWILHWRVAGWIFPVALGSCWGAAWLPRRLFHTLRPGRLVTAG